MYDFCGLVLVKREEVLRVCEREREREKTVRVKESEWLGLVEQSNGLGNRHFWLAKTQFA